MPKTPKPIKLDKAPKKDPAYTTERVTVGNTRAAAAREHLTRAREQLDAACRDLCDVYGASPVYQAIAALSNSARDAFYSLEEGIDAGCFAAASSSAKADEPKHQSCGAPHLVKRAS